MNDLEPLFLTEHELFGITGFKRRDKQAQWLGESGFQFKVRSNGSVLVSRRHYEFVMGGKLDQMFIGFPEPDYGSLN